MKLAQREGKDFGITQGYFGPARGRGRGYFGPNWGVLTWNMFMGRVFDKSVYMGRGILAKGGGISAKGGILAKLMAIFKI